MFCNKKDKTHPGDCRGSGRTISILTATEVRAQQSHSQRGENGQQSPVQTTEALSRRRLAAIAAWATGVGSGGHPGRGAGRGEEEWSAAGERQAVTKIFILFQGFHFHTCAKVNNNNTNIIPNQETARTSLAHG